MGPAFEAFNRIHPIDSGLIQRREYITGTDAKSIRPKYRSILSYCVADYRYQSTMDTLVSVTDEEARKSSADEKVCALKFLKHAALNPGDMERSKQRPE
jgi:hypothetical protein